MAESNKGVPDIFQQLASGKVEQPQKPGKKRGAKPAPLPVNEPTAELERFQREWLSVHNDIIWTDL